LADKTHVESLIQNDQTFVQTNLEPTTQENLSTPNTPLHLDRFHDYTILEQFPTYGSQADIYIIQRDYQKYVLKLYRFGLEPKLEIVEKLKFLSQNYPDDIVQIYEIAYDNTLKRWYEIQEHIEYGSLENFKKQPPSQEEFRQIVIEITQILHTIHSQNIIHRDLKPDNLLIRRKDPLQLVMTDFGISSVLDSQLSKRMTSQSGTKIYFAPESFSGVIGKEVDYWALGMILLELLSGENIFKELDENYIAYTLSTQAIPIPKSIPSDFAYLLKGLLTQNPDKRWGYAQIMRWLEGDREIPLEYHSSEGGYEKPYVVNGKKYYDLAQLVTQFVATPQDWEMGKAHLYRGYLTQWCQNNNDFDNAIKIDALKQSKDDDAALFRLIYTYHHDLDFAIGGKLINSQNLALYMGKYLNNTASPQEKRIVGLVLTGKIHNYYTLYKDFTGKGDDFEKILQSIVEYYQDNAFDGVEKIKDMIRFLKIAHTKEKYYFSYEVLMAHEDLLIVREDFDRLKSHFELPQEIVAMLESGKFYRKTLKYLRKLMAFEYASYYLPIDFNQRLLEDFESTVDATEHFIPKALFDAKIDETFVPEFLRVAIQNATMDEYIKNAHIIKRLDSLEKAQYQKLSLNHYLPSIETHIDKSEFERFVMQVDAINELIVEGLLIEKETLKTLSLLIPQTLQECIKKGEYDLAIAKGVAKLKAFPLDEYLLPDSFYSQLENNFLFVTANLDKFLKKIDYERYFVSHRMTISLLKSNFTRYLALSRLIAQNAIDEEYLKALQKDRVFLEAFEIELDNLNEIDEKSLKMIAKIKNAYVDRDAYMQLMAMYEPVMRSQSDKIKLYFKQLRWLNTPWEPIDTLIVASIYNYRMTLKTTFENITYNTFTRYAALSLKISLATLPIGFWVSHTQSNLARFVGLLIYIPVAVVGIIGHEDLKLIQIFTHPLRIVLDNIQSNEKFSRRIERVAREAKVVTTTNPK